MLNMNGGNLYMNNQTTAIRLRLLRKEYKTEDGKKLTLDRLSEELKKKFNLTISKESLRIYEFAALNKDNHTKARKVCKMAIETLYALAKFYNVSTDYILGLTNNKEIEDETLKAIGETTGLNKTATRILFTNEHTAYKAYIVETLNTIGMHGMDFFKNILRYFYSHKTLFYGVEDMPSNEVNRVGLCLIEEGIFNHYSDPNKKMEAIRKTAKVSNKCLYGIVEQSVYNTKFYPLNSEWGSNVIEAAMLKMVEENLCELNKIVKNKTLQKIANVFNKDIDNNIQKQDNAINLTESELRDFIRQTILKSYEISQERSEEESLSEHNKM